MSTDAVNKGYADALTSNMAYMVFSISIGDIGTGITSFTSTNNFITGIVFTNLGGTPNKSYYTVNVDTTKVFGGEDYYVIPTWRGLRATPSDLDNDVFPLSV